MPNVKAEIHKHNKNTLEKAQQKHPDTQLCNCTNKKQCPLNGLCLTESIVYQGVLEGNRTEPNTHNKVESIKEMPRL